MLKGRDLPMTPVFKNGVLNPTITRPSQLVEACIKNVDEKLQKLVKQYHLDQLAAYRIDEEKGTMTFLLKDESEHEFDVVPAGVWNAQSHQWVWSWSNSDMGAGLYAKSTALKKLSDIITAPDFSEPMIVCDAYRSQTLSCIATEYLGGIGRFVAPQGDFRLHFILLKKR